MGRGRNLFALLLVIWVATFTATASCAAPAWAAPCPEGLEAAAIEHAKQMQVEQYATRDATIDNQVGVEPASMFDLNTHACHSAPGQHFRIFGQPICLAAEDDGTVNVRYPFQIRYRAAETIELLFEEPWKEGTDGLWQVRFESQPDGWAAIGQREVLDLGDTKPGHDAGKP